jgi:hypothetical protein
MASNRSTITSRSATEPAGSPRDALANVARHTARIQIAALGAAGKALAGWVQAADRLAEAIGDELLRRVEGETDSGELIACVASATNVHLRELTALPGAFADHFEARLSRTSTDTRSFS